MFVDSCTLAVFGVRHAAFTGTLLEPLMQFLPVVVAVVLRADRLFERAVSCFVAAVGWSFLAHFLTHLS